MTRKQFAGGITLVIWMAASPLIFTFSILCALGRGLRWTWHEVNTTARLEIGSFGPSLREITDKMKGNPVP